MLNIGNVNDSIMKGQTKFARWKRKFTQDFNEPYLEQVKAGTWAAMPPEVK